MARSGKSTSPYLATQVIDRRPPVPRRLLRGAKPKTYRLRPPASEPKPLPPPPTLWQRSLGLSFSSLILTGMLGAIALAVGGLWVGVRAIVQPDSLPWLQDWLPSWTEAPVNPGDFQTLAQIRAQLAASRQLAGEPMPLDDNGTVLLPVLSPADPCYTDLALCYGIEQLRVYQPETAKKQPDRPQRYKLASQLETAGPEESFAIAPLVDASSPQGSSQKLPLQSIESIDRGAPDTGHWFQLSGQYARNSPTTLYGAIVHYNTDSRHLRFMLHWTSPQRQFPRWKNLTGNETPELIVDRTTDTTPDFKVYQLEPLKFRPDPIQLRPISFSEPALDRSDYQNAMLLARSGLWSPAVERLDRVRRGIASDEGTWPPVAQAQLDALRYHAKVSKAQANSPQISGARHIVMEMVDGRWQDALKRFQDDTGSHEEVARILRSDTGELWKRIEAELRVDANRPAVKLWALMLIAAQRGRPAAIAWYRRSPYDTPDLDRQVDDVLSAIDRALLSRG